MELVVERMMEPSSNQEMGWQVSFDSRLRAMGCDSIEPRTHTDTDTQGSMSRQW